MEHLAEGMLQTICMALAFGVALVVLAKKSGVSLIAFLLIGGVLLGPEGLGLIRPESLGKSLEIVIALSVALILFEGGLTLDLRGYRRAGVVIRRLLSLGVAATWFITAAAIAMLFGFRAEFSLLAASLVIVTGPTVIVPLLRRLRVRQDLHHILHWEGVLIDPIGVFIAILCFETIDPVVGGGLAAGKFMFRIVVGLGLGVLIGYVADFLIRRNWIPDDSANIFVLAVALLTYALCDQLVPESGLLGVVTAGFVLGVRRPEPLERIQEFKYQLTELLIALLFMLLAANLELDEFRRFGLKGALLVGIVMLVVRPAGIFLSVRGRKFSLRDKVFLSWIAPRGIVAASMASLFALRMGRAGNPDAWFLETFTYSVIVATVILQGVTAGLVARLLGVRRPDPTGWLIVGANRLGRGLARFVREKAGRPVVIVDTNPRAVAEARAEGQQAVQVNALAPELPESEDMAAVGYVLAITDNEDLNALICQRWMKYVGRGHVLRWSSDKTAGQPASGLVGKIAFATLPKPSIVAAELAGNEASLAMVPAEETNESLAGAILLGHVQDGEVEFYRQPPQERPKTGTFLYVRRPSPQLIRCVRPELILKLERAESIEELLETLLDRIVTESPTIPRETTLKELLERERSFPTAIGGGVAVPHGYCSALQRPLCAVAQLTEGVSFSSPDKAPVHLVFLLLSPPGDPRQHLALLAEIAQLCSNVDLRERLKTASIPDGVMTLLAPGAPSGK